MIDKDALIAEYDRVHIGPAGGARKLMEDSPTVDAVEVVRCKDCRHWREDIGWCDINSHFVDDNDAPCSPEDSPNWRMFNANDFCSYGERRVSE